MATSKAKSDAEPKQKRARRPATKAEQKAATDKRDWTRIKKLPVEERYLEAIEKCRGRITHIARGLEVLPNTARVTINRNPTLHSALVNARDGVLDDAEEALMDQIGRGNVQATQFMLKTQGKSRGYSDKDTREKLETEILREFLERIEKVVASDVYDTIIIALTGSEAEAERAGSQEAGGTAASPTGSN